MARDVMGFEFWKNETWGLARRSAELQAIDTALLAYHSSSPMLADLAKQSLRKALKAWMAKEDKERSGGWKSSPRNRKGTVSRLCTELFESDRGPTPQDLGAMWEMEYEAQYGVLDRFRGLRLEWRPGYFQKLADNKWGVHTGVLSAANDVRRLASPSGPPAASDSVKAEAKQIADRIFQLAIPDEVPSGVRAEVQRVVTEMVLPGFMRQLIADLVPVAGFIKSAGSTLWSAGTLIRAEYREWSAQRSLDLRLNRGTPQMAMESVVRILRRETNYEAISASANVSAFAAQFANVLPGGTAVSTAASLTASVVKLTNIVRIILRDVQERNMGNDLLLKTRPDITTFQVCPVIGAYYFCCAPDSVLANDLVERLISGGAEEVRYYILEHVKPVQQQARRVIQSHRFYIQALQNFPGVLMPNAAAIAADIRKRGKYPHIEGPARA
jgi:hypothetical protein